MKTRLQNLLLTIIASAVVFCFFTGCGKKETSKDSIPDNGNRTEALTNEQEDKKEIKLPEKNSPEEYYNYGVENIKKGRFEEAIAAWEKALEIDPTFDKVFPKLGKAYYTLGEFNKAGEVYRKELEFKPNDPTVYFSLGVVYRMNEQFDDAVRMQQKALTLNPDFASAYNELGLTYSKQKRLDEAITAHKNALTLDPNLGNAHNYLGVVYLLKGMSAEAEKEFEEYKKFEAAKSGAPPAH
ncbi:MAG: tetratricopeptide repeat protein [Candidatus Brocadiaceae bacterium]|nr:tetratricopeptide repeat protein [Candidatus Brocadiaceae bacterium]